MKILDNKNSVEITCPNCQSRLEIVENDVHLDLRTEDLYVVCGACHIDFGIDPHIIPRSWSEYIQNLYDED
jgi:hypothetical protein